MTPIALARRRTPTSRRIMLSAEDPVDPSPQPEHERVAAFYARMAAEQRSPGAASAKAAAFEATQRRGPWLLPESGYQGDS